MNDIETRLREASEEVRKLAGRRPRPTLYKPSPTRRRWPAFAGAFIMVITVGLIPSLIGGGGQSPAASTLAPSTTTPVAPTTTVEERSCSATGNDIPTTPEGLPPAVGKRFTEIVQAAAGCDLSALERLAGADFVTSFGGGGAENLGLWETEGSGRLGTLLKLMGMSHAVNTTGDGAAIYVWPAAFAYDTWDEIPPKHVDELRDLYTQEELSQIAEFGPYAGWRTGIAESGDWLFFVAGD